MTRGKLAPHLSRTVVNVDTPSERLAKSEQLSHSWEAERALESAEIWIKLALSELADVRVLPEPDRIAIMKAYDLVRVQRARLNILIKRMPRG